MPDGGPAAQRVRLGSLCAGFGLLLLAPPLFIWLSSHGPAPVAVSAAVWSRCYYGAFIALVSIGFGGLFVDASRAKVFHGGPMIDFSIGMAGTMIALGFGRAWVPGAFLIGFGLRLMTGAPLLDR